MGLSIRAYARHRGVSDTAVHKAIREGRISREADGSIDADKADREWVRNTESPRKNRPAMTASAAIEPVSVSPPQRSEPAAPALSIGGTTLLQARTANEVIKAQRQKIGLARDREEIVDRAQAIAHVFTLARAERDAWLNWPARVSAQMAAGLGVDSHALHVAMDAAVREQLQDLGDLQPKVD